MSFYGEYLNRASWAPSEKLHLWIAEKMIKQCIKYAQKDFSDVYFLEIGTGTGRIASQLKKYKVAQYLGIEPSQALANHARAVHQINVLEESLPNLSLINNTFDIVFSYHVMEHASSWTEAYKWAQEMLRVTKPGGIIIIACPDIRDYKQFFWDGDFSHGYPTTPKRLTQLFQDLDVDILRSTSFYLGHDNILAACIANIISSLIPTRLVDAITIFIVGRPLASGIKIALLWGLTFIALKKKI